ncbi:MAG: carbohydrate binding domain-containing protein, partial [Armatimonadota bacterium]|nr:carbohydrate binding domain-containing protein [Armatimonadota bacterium]
MRWTCCYLLLLIGAASAAAAPWHHPLYLPGGGYWVERVAVTIHNPGPTECAGHPVSVTLPSLAGCRVESLRVCNAAGQELLFDVRDDRKRSKRTGRLAPNDRVILPVECPGGGRVTLYVYAQNPLALAVPDYLAPGELINGGFEAGNGEPEGWIASLADPQHRLLYLRTGGRSGGSCVKTEVDRGAPGTWVAWRQLGIRVRPGETYRFSGWVRAENVSGTAGWYVHVDGDRPQLINRVLNAGEGTYDWREVTLTFTVPPTGSHVAVGTVLNGTGSAWFDDATLEASSTAPPLEVTVGSVERLAAPATAKRPFRPTPQWPYRAVVRVLNGSDHPATSALVSADLRRVLGRARGVPANAAARVVDPLTGKSLEPTLRLGSDLLFAASMPARSVREFHVYLSGTARVDEKAFLAAYARLMHSPMNLAPNPSFEAAEDRPEGWTCAGERLSQ